MLKIMDIFWVLLSQKSTETLKVWKSESLKSESLKSESLKSEMLSDSKNFFFLVFLGPSRVQIRKKNKSEIFEKFGHFLLPVLRNKAQGLTPSGIVLNELSSMQKMATRRWFQSWRVLSMVLLLGTTFHRPSGRADAGAPPL